MRKIGFLFSYSEPSVLKHAKFVLYLFRKTCYYPLCYASLIVPVDILKSESGTSSKFFCRLLAYCKDPFFSTVILMPLIVGFPTITSGSIVIRSKGFFCMLSTSLSYELIQFIINTGSFLSISSIGVPLGSDQATLSIFIQYYPNNRCFRGLGCCFCC
jgi:hypothetical protein